MADQEIVGVIPNMNGRNPLVYREPETGDIVVATVDRLADGTVAVGTFLFTVKANGIIEIAGNQPCQVEIVSDIAT